LASLVLIAAFSIGTSWENEDAGVTFFFIWVADFESRNRLVLLKIRYLSLGPDRERFRGKDSGGGQDQKKEGGKRFFGEGEVRHGDGF